MFPQCLCSPTESACKDGASFVRNSHLLPLTEVEVRGNLVTLDLGICFVNLSSVQNIASNTIFNISFMGSLNASRTFPSAIAPARRE